MTGQEIRGMTLSLKHVRSCRRGGKEEDVPRIRCWEDEDQSHMTAEGFYVKFYRSGSEL